MIVLGIESSCDETSVAIVEKSKKRVFGKVLSENTLSQIKKHQKFGGVVPELASREHSTCLDFLVRKTIKESKIKLDQINAFSATLGPGLLGGLLIGSNYAKTLALIMKKPFLGINHLQAHILVARMRSKISYPFLCLLVSGGHTQILISKSYNNFELLGETLDDALGEAFDKVAKLLGYHYPGGPKIEKLASKFKGERKIKLPRPLINQKNLNFSFSGIKTSVRQLIESSKVLNKYELASEFQESVTECLLKKCESAIDYFKKKNGLSSFILAGGVASNKYIREKIKFLCQAKSMKFMVPEQELCVDNATMIAWAGLERLENGDIGDSLESQAKPRWELEKI